MTTKEISRMERQMEELGLSFEVREFFVLLALEDHIEVE